MITGNKINLTSLQEKDLEMIRNWRNKYKHNFYDESYITKEKQREFYNNLKQSSDYFFIIRLKDETPIGTIALYDLRLDDRSATLGRFLLLDEYRGQGIATEAVTLVTEFADKLRLWKIRVDCKEDNIDAIRVYERCGYIKRPIVCFERINHSYNWNIPMKVISYDDMSETGYEGQNTNIKVSDIDQWRLSGKE